MRVITLDTDAFAAACHQLQQMATPFRPDLIVGIANGGVHVAAQIFADLPHMVAQCSRTTTAAKEKHRFFFKIIRRLPLWVRNALRIIEASLLRTRAKSTEPVLLGDASRAGRILIVDDAIDSGNTMEAVLALFPGKEVRTAVITVTTRNPRVRPDYVLYDTLIRFPWSKDA